MGDDPVRGCPRRGVPRRARRCSSGACCKLARVATHPEPRPCDVTPGTDDRSGPGRTTDGHGRPTLTTTDRRDASRFPRRLAALAQLHRPPSNGSLPCASAPRSSFPRSAVAVLALVACSDDDGTTATEPPPPPSAASAATDHAWLGRHRRRRRRPTVPGRPLPGQQGGRHDPYLAGFDFAASARSSSRVAAKGLLRGHVPRRRAQPGFSTANYPLVAAEQAQFSSAGSYSEIVDRRRQRRRARRPRRRRHGRRSTARS